MEVNYLKAAILSQKMIEQKQVKNVEYVFFFFGSMITNNERCTCAIESRLSVAKAEINKKTFHHKFGLKLVKKKQEKCYVWSVALYGAETWTLRKVDKKHLKRS
jgi:hypothetical protein